MYFSTADIETFGLGGALRVICYYDGARSYSFKDFRSFIDHLAANRTIDYCYFHFGGGYDFLYLIEFMMKNKSLGYKLVAEKFFEVHGKIISFQMEVMGRIIEFRDSYSLLPMSLDKLGKSLTGRGKSGKGEEAEYMSDAEVEEYCVNDCVLLYDVLVETMKHIGGFPKITIASESMRQLLKFRGEKDFPFEKPNKYIYEHMQMGNFGGHVDVYKRYCSPVYCGDIASCYPYAAIKAGCPTGKARLTQKRNAGKAGLYYARIKLDSWNPCLPVQRDKLYFPTGEGYYWITDIFYDKFPELVKGIFWGVEYDIDQDYFKGYMEKWFSYRQLNPASSLIGKQFMNNLIGKFAIKRLRRSYAIGESENFIGYVNLDLKLGIETKELEYCPYSNPLVNSRVTEYGRIHLMNMQNRAGGSLAYSDTDSVKAGSKFDVEREKFLGGLIDEGVWDEGIFLAPKLYGLFNKNGEKHVVGKGIFSEQAEKLTREDFYQALQNGVGLSVKQIKLESWKIRARSTFEIVKAFEMKRILKNFEIKRLILGNKNDTIPYRYCALPQ